MNRRLSKMLVLTATLISLAACGMEETKHASASDTPANWWSDNYLAMWQQDADASAAGTAHAKPLKLQ